MKNTTQSYLIVAGISLIIVFLGIHPLVNKLYIQELKAAVEKSAVDTNFISPQEAARVKEVLPLKDGSKIWAMHYGIARPEDMFEEMLTMLPPTSVWIGSMEVLEDFKKKFFNGNISLTNRNDTIVFVSKHQLMAQEKNVNFYVWKGGRLCYPVVKYVMQTGESFNDTLYVGIKNQVNAWFLLHETK